MAFWGSKSGKKKSDNAEEGLPDEPLIEIEEIEPEKSEIELFTEEKEREIKALYAKADHHISELNKRNDQLLREVNETRERLRLLDEANMGMARMVQERDQIIEGLRAGGDEATLVPSTDDNGTKAKLSKAESEIQQLKDQLTTAQATISTLQQDAENRVTTNVQAADLRREWDSQDGAEIPQPVLELRQQLQSLQADADQRIHELSARLHMAQDALAEAQTAEKNALAAVAQAKQQIQTLSNQREQSQQAPVNVQESLDENFKQAAARITQLEKQLAESEAKSASRAEQRSALLRNLAEIHRLSATAARPEPAQAGDSLKVVAPGKWSEPGRQSSTNDPEKGGGNTLFSRSGT